MDTIIFLLRFFRLLGFPEHLPYPAFQRRYMGLLSPEEQVSLPSEDKTATEFIISGLEDLDRSMYRLGLSQVSLACS